jgi:hypothetical protein
MPLRLEAAILSQIRDELCREPHHVCWINRIFERTTEGSRDRARELDAVMLCALENPAVRGDGYF